MKGRGLLATFALGAGLIAACQRTASAGSPGSPTAPPGPASMPAETRPAETRPAESAPATLPVAPVETGPAGAPVAPPREVAPKAAEESKVRTAAWVTSFIGVSAVALGAGLSILALSRTRVIERDLADGEIEWRRWDALTTEGAELSVGAYTLMGAGVAVTAAGIYLLLRKEKDPGFVIAASPLPGGGLALARAAF